MTVDVEFYRRTIYIPIDGAEKNLRRISVFDIHPDDATRTIVFVHGYGGNALQWLNQLRFFGQTMRVVAPELRGHGLSDDPETLPYTMDGLVNDLEKILEALAVPRPFALIAHSFGGAIAAEYALRHPEDVTSLVLIGVPSNFVVQRAASHLMGVPDPIFSRAAKLIGVALYAPQHTLKALLDHVMSKWHGEERFSQLHLPTLVILGQRDTVFLREQYEIVPRIIPGAHSVVIPVSAHLVQLERPDAVNRAIRRFIDAALPESQAGEKQRIAQRERLAAFTRLSEMPWLQQYDRDVPEMLPQPRQLLHDMVSNAARLFPERPAIIFLAKRYATANSIGSPTVSRMLCAVWAFKKATGWPLFCRIFRNILLLSTAF